MEYNIEKDAIGLYKYVVGEKHYYIGKSENGTILDRLKRHEKEEKFKDILDKATIYVHPMKNKVEINAMEKLLINRYKPELNVVDTNGDGTECVFEEPEWELCYSPDLLTIPKYIQHKKGIFSDAFDYISDYIQKLKTYKWLLELYKKFGSNKEKCIKFVCADNDFTDKLSCFLTINEVCIACPVIKKIEITGSDQSGYNYCVHIYLAESFCEDIKDTDIDVLMSNIDDVISQSACLEYMNSNIAMMLDKISQSITSTGEWHDLEDAGWAFLRMLNLDKQIYISQEAEDYYKKARVNKDGEYVNLEN